MQLKPLQSKVCTQQNQEVDDLLDKQNVHLTYDHPTVPGCHEYGHARPVIPS